ncbi:MAG: cysteine desulfurase [Treponema sp.]|nr:cysteine desulfurase [Treponema sp.]
MPVNPELYFDWAATAIPDQDILETALKESLAAWANPSSVHAAGKEARSALEKARSDCASVLGVQAKQIIFTSGGTESDHIPLLAILNRPEKGNVAVSSIEHPALREMAEELKKVGIECRLIPSDKNGFVTPETVLQTVDEKTLFVSVMAVNNETGAIQPVKEIAAALEEAYKGKRKPRFHVDCVQALGKVPIDFLNEPGLDSAAFSAHKICGPRGIGILYLKKEEEIFLRGGGQEGGVRSGTENLFGAIAFAKCLERHAIPAPVAEAKNGGKTKSAARFEEQKKWTASFIRGLLSIKGAAIIPEARGVLSQEGASGASGGAFGANDNSGDNFSPWVVQASFNKIPGQVMLRALDAKGICVSTGSACSSKKASRPILEAMGVPAAQRETSVRFSFGPKTTQAGMDALLDAVKEVCVAFE